MTTSKTATTSMPSSSAAGTGTGSTPGPAAINHSPSEVAWMFVREYYHHLNREPSRLHLFYSKESAIIHGMEGVHVELTIGQSNIQKLMSTINYKDARVVVSNVDSQLSSNNGVMVQVLGELSNNNKPSQKFVQSFFLAKQPAGYFVLNDIFRYLCEEDMDDQSVKEDEIISTKEPDFKAEPVKAKPLVKEEVKQPKSREPSPVHRVSDPVVNKTKQVDASKHDMPVSQDVRALQVKDNLPVKKETVPVNNKPAAPTTWAQLARSNTPASQQQQQQPKTTSTEQADPAVTKQRASSPKPQQQALPTVSVNGHENVHIFGSPGQELPSSKMPHIHSDFEKSVWLKLHFPHHSGMPVDYLLSKFDSKEVQVKSVIYNKVGAVVHLSSIEQAKLLIGRKIAYNEREMTVEPRKSPTGGSGRYGNNNQNGHYGRGYRNNGPQQEQQQQFAGSGRGGGGNRNSSARGGGRGNSGAGSAS